MDTLSYKTLSATKASSNKQWLLVDAEGQTLGRVCSVIAKLLRGKHKACFTPHADCGDYVIVINAEKVKFSSEKKWDAKEYIWHTGYPGGQKSLTAAEVFEKKPEKLVEKSVKGMLPKNKLGAELFRNLKVVVGPAHKYEAQQPKLVNLEELL